MRQNKKNLIRRTKKKKARREKRTALIERRRIAKAPIEPFHAPLVFSFIMNADGTAQFFEELISFLIEKKNYGKKLFIDVSEIKILTIDALMYLLATVTNLNKNFQAKYSFRGNLPKDPEIRKLVEDSGFYQYVRYYGVEPITRSTDNIQIVSGNKVDTSLAKRICDFVMEKGSVTKLRIGFLYNMMIELMANVYAHAYNEKGNVLYSRWYCFAEYDLASNTVCFSFMDTGSGIPSTIRKHGFEILDFLNLKDDGSYVISALKGELRSKTKKLYRGKGLPKILSYCQNNQIQDMRIITNKCDVRIQRMELKSKGLSSPLKGTLFYWRINLSDRAVDLQ